MNRYESILLDKMVELRMEENELASGVHGTDVLTEMHLIGAESCSCSIASASGVALHPSRLKAGAGRW